MKLSKNRRRLGWRRSRLAVSFGLLALFLAGFILPDLARGAAGLLAAVQLVPALLRAACLPSAITAPAAAGLGQSFIDGALLAGAAAALVLLSAALFGRVYCSSLCPLGTCQDLTAPAVRRLAGGSGRRFRGHDYLREKRLLRFGLAASAGLAAAFGLPLLLDLIEPFSFFGRMAHGLVLPAASLVSQAAAELGRRLGTRFAPLEAGFEPLASAVAGAAAVLLLAMVMRRGRLFCDSLCPAGSLLRLAAARPVFRLSVDEGLCTACGACGRVCPVGCIRPGAGKAPPAIEEGRCVRCFDCLAACPERAIAFGPKPGPFSPSRRSFLAAAAVSLPVLAGLSAARPLSASPGGDVSDPPLPPGAAPPPSLPPLEAKPGLPAFAAPPGAWSVERFGSICTACQLCVSVCPTRVLRPAPFGPGGRGFMQPVMDYRAGYCEYPCIRCAEVCPTGAITPIPLRRKQTTKIGTARLYRDKCVVFERGTACGACAEVCPTHAVHMIPYRPGLTAPETDYSLCIGCGHCEYACPVAMDGQGRPLTGTSFERTPVAELKAIMVEPAAVHELVDDRKRPQAEPAPQPPGKPGVEGKKEDFPF